MEKMTQKRRKFMIYTRNRKVDTLNYVISKLASFIYKNLNGKSEIKISQTVDSFSDVNSPALKILSIFMRIKFTNKIIMTRSEFIDELLDVLDYDVLKLWLDHVNIKLPDLKWEIETLVSLRISQREFAYINTKGEVIIEEPGKEIKTIRQ